MAAKSLALAILACLFAQDLAKPQKGEIHDKGFDLLFRSQPKEVESSQIVFDKALPSWLTGTLMHNGPARFDVGGNRSMTHWYDGWAKIHAFRFAKGGKTASFSAKFVQSTYYKTSVESGNIQPYLTFGPMDPPFVGRDDEARSRNGMDNPNDSIKPFRDTIITVADMWRIYGVDNDLKTRAILPPAPIESSTHNALSSGHPLPEGDTGNWLTFYMQMNSDDGKIELAAIRIITSEIREVIATIKLDRVPYLHAFGATEKYMVIYINPVYHMETVEYHGDGKTDVYVIDLGTGEVTKMETEAILMLHHVNTFHSSPDVIESDMITFAGSEQINDLTLTKLRDAELRQEISDIDAICKRYTMNLRTKQVTVSEHAVLPGNEMMTHFDFPQINMERRFKPYCYVYGTTWKGDQFAFSHERLTKKDICDPAGDKFWWEPNQYPSEALFVSAPNPQSEDDGILLSIVLDGNIGKSYLGVIDARTMKLISRGYTDDFIPFPFHGNFFKNM